MATLPDAQYGEQAAFQQAQQGAPMGAPQSGPAATAPASGPMLTPLDAPSARPGEEVTSGAALGPGVGPEALGLGPSAMQDEDTERLKTYLPALIEMANRPDSTSSFRNYVRQLRSRTR